MSTEAAQRVWYKRIPFVSAVGRLVWFTGRGVVLTGELLWAIGPGELDEDWWDRFLEWYSDGFDAYNDAVEVITYSYILAAAIALGQVEAAVAAGRFDVIINSKVGRAVAAIWAGYELLRGKFDEEVARIKGTLDWAAIDATIDNLKIAHQVGLQFNENYRESVEDFYRNTADLSRQVFGPANSLFHGLALLQLVVNDSIRLQGGTPAQGQARYLTRAVNASERVAKNSSKYAKDGSLFWGDFQVHYLQPMIDEQYNKQIDRDSLIGRIDTRATQAGEAVVGLSDSFSTYREHLAPFLSDENIANLAAIQKGFDTDIRKPVERFQGFMADNFPDIQEHVTQLENSDRILAEGVLESLERTADPSALTEFEKINQGRRINSIMDNAMLVGIGNSGAPREIRRDMIIVTSIYDRLGEKWR